MDLTLLKNGMYVELPRLDIFKYVQAVADENNLPTYAVGGYVRDLILQRPVKDIDFVCLGSGIDCANKVAERIHPNPQVVVFKNFGTAMFPFQNMDVEFVGARKESYERNSRKPFVEEGSLADDQNRRDFTINALAIGINSDNYGRLIDPFNGLDDLRRGILRTPLDPDITFSDDPLRMMRAIRFATQLEFSIEKNTLEAIRRNAERIRIISQERITDELNKIILSKHPSIGFQLLSETALLPIIFPEFEALKGAETQKGLSHKDNFYHTLQVLENVCIKSDDLWLRWAALLHDIAKPLTKRFDERLGWTFHGHEVVGSKMVPKLFKRFRLPLDHKMKFVQKLVFLHLRPIVLHKEEISDAAIRRLLFEAAEDIDSLMTLCEADITSKNKSKVSRYLQNFALVRLKMQEIEEKDRLRNFQPPISGELIMKTFGLSPCKEVGLIKDAIKDAILDGKISNDEQQAFTMMLEMGEALGLKPIRNDQS